MFDYPIVRRFDTKGERGYELVREEMGPLLAGTGDIKTVKLKHINENLALLPGDIRLSGIEDDLNSNWSDCITGNEQAFRFISAFWRMTQGAAEEFAADIVLINVGPNLGALNRAALICAEFVVVPLAPDLYSLQGLGNLGPTLRKWRHEWKQRLTVSNLDWHLSLPTGKMSPIGYVVLQHAMRTDRPVLTYSKWMACIPSTYAKHVLDSEFDPDSVRVVTDDNCLALLKNYRSLMPLSEEARRPMFLLRAADGAIGGHAKAVQDCYTDFQALAREIDEHSASLKAP